MNQQKHTHRPGASLKSPKLLCIAEWAVAGITRGIPTASAAVNCSGSGKFQNPNK